MTTDDYRYDRVTMGILMKDFAFGRESLKSGDPFPDFELTTTQLRTITKQDVVRDRPALLTFGSMTCPMTASSIDPLKRLHQEFGLYVDFIMLNVREAHPAERIGQPQAFDDKLDHARKLKSLFEIPWTVATDDIDGTLHRALDPKPNAAYLINTDGCIVFRSLWAGDEAALHPALRALVSGYALPKTESRRTLAPLLRGIGYFREILGRAGPKAMRDMLWAAPPVAMLGRMAGMFSRLAPHRRGASAVALLIGLVVAAVGVGVVL